MNGDGMDDQPTADLETTLTAWGRAAVRTEEQSPRSYASATSQVPRPRRAILASAAAITALASTVAIWNSRETHSPPPAALTPAPCQQQFGTGRVDSEFQSLPPTITVALTYAGNGRCTIDAHAPHLELRDSKQRVLLEQDQSATYDLRRITVAPGDEITFQVQEFLGCFRAPPDKYTLNVFLASSHADDGVAVPVEQEVSSVFPVPGCRQSTIGKVSDLRRGA